MVELFGAASVRRRPFLTRFGIATVLVLAAAYVGTGGGTAHAALGGCINDPIITLDHQRFQITASIAAVPSQVASIVYTVHVPANTDVKKVKYVKSVLQPIEQLQIIYDQPPGQMVASTTVVATDGGSYVVSVEINSKQQDLVVTGTTGQTLTAQLALNGD